MVDSLAVATPSTESNPKADVDPEKVDQLVGTLRCLEASSGWDNLDDQTLVLRTASGDVDFEATMRCAVSQDVIRSLPQLELGPSATKIPLTSERHFQIAERLLRSKSDAEITGQQFFRSRALLLEVPSIHMPVVSLCLDVGFKAAKASLFTTAVEYLEFGVWLIENSPESWWEHESTYDLALSIYSAAAETNHSVANVQRAMELADQVLRHGASTHDKITAYATQVSILGQVGKFDESIKIGFAVLKKLGHSMHPSPSLRHVVYHSLRLRLRLHTRSKELILREPEMTDEAALDAMRVLHLMFTDALIARPMLLLFISLQMVRLTTDYGLCVISAPAFAVFGVLLGIAKDPKNGEKFVDVALALQERYQMREWLPRTHALVYGVARGRSQLALDRLDDAYRIGKETGDVTYAFVARQLQVYCKLFMGACLSETTSDFAALMNEARSQNHSYRAEFCSMSLRFSQILVGGVSTCPTPPATKLFPENHRMSVMYKILIAHLVLGDHEQVLAVVKKFPQLETFVAMHPLFVDVGLKATISRLVLRRRRSSNLLPMLPCTFVRRLEQLAIARPDWCSSKLFLVKAELAWTRGNYRKAYFHYRNSISCCCIPYERGLVLECYGRFYMERRLFRNALDQYSLAREAYTEMGAHAVSERLEKQIAHIRKLDLGRASDTCVSQQI